MRVEWETLKYVDWFNNRRIHESLYYVPLVEFEDHYSALSASDRLVALEMISSPAIPSRFSCRAVSMRSRRVSWNGPSPSCGCSCGCSHSHWRQDPSAC